MILNGQLLTVTLLREEFPQAMCKSRHDAAHQDKTHHKITGFLI